MLTWWGSLRTALSCLQCPSVRVRPPWPCHTHSPARRHIMKYALRTRHIICITHPRPACRLYAALSPPIAGSLAARRSAHSRRLLYRPHLSLLVAPRQPTVDHARTHTHTLSLTHTSHAHILPALAAHAPLITRRAPCGSCLANYALQIMPCPRRERGRLETWTCRRGVRTHCSRTSLA